MNSFFGVLIQDGYSYIRKHPQLLVTLALVIIIPFAFLFSGQQFLNAARQNIATVEKDKAQLLHEIVASFVSRSQSEQLPLASTLSSLVESYKTITTIQIVVKTPEGYTVRARSNPTEIEVPLSETSLFDRAHINPESVVIFPFVHKFERMWHTVSLTTLPDTTEQGYIYIQFSHADADALFAERITKAYYWLFALLLIVMLFIIRHIRLIDYAYLYRETKRANEMKDLFTNMIAHELRTPLTAIVGYASLAQQQITPEAPYAAHVSKISKSAARLIALVNDLLDVARIQSGKLAIKNAPVNIVAVIQSVIDEMSLVAREKNITITAELPSNQLLISIDEKRLLQALTNLVNNSIKYTHEGSIAVSLVEREKVIEIRVKDTGKGISAVNQRQLFAPFFRVHDDEDDTTVGTGLGMWITQQLVLQMSGTIDVESIEGIGTHIVVIFPK